MAIFCKDEIMLLTDLLERNARFFAVTPALTMRMGYRTVTLNYAQVYELSCKVAEFLKQQEIGKNDKVLIFAPNSPFWVCVFFGAMLNGSVAVPVNIQSTSEILKKIIEQTQAKIVFKSRQLKRDLFGDVQIFDIEFIDELTHDINLQNFKRAELEEDDLLEILYTSGTTGDPKGVMLSHKNIYSNVLSIIKVIELKPQSERLLSVLPLTHILEQTIGLFLAFHFGEHVVYAHSYAAIGNLLQEFKISKMVVVPELLKVLMDRIKGDAVKNGKFWLLQKMMNFSSKINCRPLSKILFYFVLKKLGGRLDTVASGGAPLDITLEKEWNALGVFVIQGYGLTETSPVISLNSFDKHKFASVGKILEGVQVKIASDGEILARGPNVFQGYYKNESKTKEAFSSDSWFMTGDIGYFDSDGFLFLKGRKKYMILGPGGQNVFPEDIETELNKVPEIKDSCVLGLDNAGKSTLIHAVLLCNNKATDTEKIIDSVNENLASYQQINSWSTWDEDDFPRSATRKIKRDEVIKVILAKQSGDICENIESHSKIANILSLVSGVELRNIHSNTRIVRDLNIDSLMRVEFVMRVEQELGFSLDETFINANTTVSQLEDIIKQKKFSLHKIELKKWPCSWWAKIVRAVGQFWILLFTKIFMKVEIDGLENIQDVSTPVIFMPNHNSYFDPLAVLQILPFKIRKRLTFAAAEDVLYGKFKWISWLGELFFNTFSLPRSEESNIRAGLDVMGKALDKGLYVVVFPEGKISVDGKFQPLKSGAGLMAVEMHVPIIPIKIDGIENLAPYGSFIPRRRVVVKIKIGKPIKFKKADSYESARIQIENTMRSL
ncbi:MAG: Acyltransferase family protein [candidate division TM6 bacterium GW2011_GWF2_37_49]|nr:MAG: Acyltransferase family protein [candidate division TM6 bacterium GW2011_GWF2_37_49]